MPAQQVKPREQYKTPEKPECMTSRPKRNRWSKVSKKRAKENRRNDQIERNFLENNPKCDCGCTRDSEHPHHICSGTHGRNASLQDTDTQLAVHSWCHDTKFDDLLAYPIERQVAMKFAAILRKINRYRGRAQTAITMKDVFKYLEVDT